MLKSNASTQTQFIPFSSVLSDPLLEADPFLISCHYIVESFSRIEHDLHVALGLKVKKRSTEEGSVGVGGKSIELMEPLLLEDHAKFRAATVASRIVQLAQESAMQQLTRISYLIPAYQENAPLAQRGREVLQAPLDPRRGNPAPQKTVFFAPVGKSRGLSSHQGVQEKVISPRSPPKPSSGSRREQRLVSPPKQSVSPKKMSLADVPFDERPVSPAARRALFHQDPQPQPMPYQQDGNVGGTTSMGNGLPPTGTVVSPRRAGTRTSPVAGKGCVSPTKTRSTWSQRLDTTFAGLDGAHGGHGSQIDLETSKGGQSLNSLQRPTFTSARAKDYVQQYERIIAKSFEQRNQTH